MMRTQSEASSATTLHHIALCEPYLSGNEWEYVRECLDTAWVSSSGSFVQRFEREVAQRLGAAQAVAVVNGTSALHLALLALGVEPDDEVLVSTLSFIAPANVIRYVGAWPVFVDAEPRYWQIDVEKVHDFLSRQCQWRNGALWNATTGRRVRAILPVHILGHPVDFDALSEVAARFDLPVIEDATESFGADYKSRPVGHLGPIACLSFNGNKLMTTGAGGMLVADNPSVAERARYLSTQAKDDPIEYRHDALGFNYRMSNVHAAIGCAQLERLDEHIAAKRRIAQRYAQELVSVPGIQTPTAAEWAASVFWMYTVLIHADTYGEGSRDVLQRLQLAGIQTRPLWQPLHLNRPYRLSQRTDCSVSEQLYRDALSLPCSVGLTEDDQQRVIQTLQRQAD